MVCYKSRCYERGCYVWVYYAKMCVHVCACVFVYVCVCICMCICVCATIPSPAVDAIVLLADVDHARCQIHPDQRSLLLLVSDRHAGPYRHYGSDKGVVMKEKCQWVLVV